MSVRIDGATIHIEGNSQVEDAEALLAALQSVPGRTIDLSRATRLHSASIQILLGFKPKIMGVPSDTFQAEFILPLVPD